MIFVTFLRSGGFISMNKSIIRYVLGHILIIEGALMLLPCLVALFYQERNGIYFLIVAALCEVIGFLMSRKKPKSYLIYTKEGCVTTALSWILLSIFGAIPFVLTGEIPSFLMLYSRLYPALQLLVQVFSLMLKVLATVQYSGEASHIG